jgi:hypothetical protein
MRFLAAALLVVTAPALLSGADLAITHEPVGCVLVGRFPELQARLDPADRVAGVRVLFRSSGDGPWYWVRMKQEAATFRALLPRPTNSLKSFVYYLEATGTDLATARTEEYVPVVVEGAGACQGRMMAAALATGEVALETTAGAPAVPVGFSAAGVVPTAAGAAVVGAAAAAGAAAAGTTAATGGGISTALLVGGGLALAAGGAAAIAVAGGGSEEIVHPGFVYVGECTCGPIMRPPPYSYATGNPIQGAVASTDLNATTATTDAQGHFELRTSEPSRRGFQISVTAPGCTTSTWRGGYGTNPTSHVTLVCSGALPPRTSSCNCASQ